MEANVDESSRLEQGLEEQFAKLEEMDNKLVEEKRRLEAKMQRFLARAKKDRVPTVKARSKSETSQSWAKLAREVNARTPSTIKSPSIRTEKRSTRKRAETKAMLFESETDGLRRRCAEISARQTSLVERAEAIASTEAKLAMRVVALEQNLDDSDEDLDGDIRTFSTATLDEAWALLADFRSRPPHDETMLPRTRVEKAWLATLRTEVAARKCDPLVSSKPPKNSSSAWRRIPDSSDDDDDDDDQWLSTWALRRRCGDEEPEQQMVVLAMRPSFPEVSDAVDYVVDAGGDVVRVVDRVVVGLFPATDVGAHLAVATGLSSEFPAAVTRGAVTATQLGPHLVVHGPAMTVALGMLHRVDTVAVAKDIAEGLVQTQNWQTTAFVLDATTDVVAVRGTAPGSREADRLAKRGRLERSDLVRKSTSSQTTEHCFATVVVVRWTGEDDESRAAMATRAAQAFRGRCTDAEKTKGETRMTFLFSEAALGVAAAFASLAALNEVSVGVASGPLQLRTVGSSRRLRIIQDTRGALDVAKRLAAHEQGVLCDRETAVKATYVVLEATAFPCLPEVESYTGKAAAVVRLERRDVIFRAAVKCDFLTEVNPASFGGSIPAVLALAVEANIVGKRQHSVTRDAATKALLAYRLAFSARSAVPPYEAILDDDDDEPGEYHLDLWDAAPLDAANFSAVVDAALPGADDATKDALWIRSRGVPARVAALTMSWRRAPHHQTTDLLPSVAARARGAHVPRALRESLLAEIDKLPQTHVVFLRCCAVGAGAGGVDTLYTTLASVPALRDAFLSPGRRTQFDGGDLVWRTAPPRSPSSPTARPVRQHRKVTLEKSSSETEVQIHPDMATTPTKRFPMDYDDDDEVDHLADLRKTPKHEQDGTTYEELFDRVLEDVVSLDLVDIDTNQKEVAYTIRDPLLADALYDAMPLEERYLLHVATVNALRRRSNLDNDQVLALAHHAYQGCDPDASFAAATEVAARGRTRYLVAAASFRLPRLPSSCHHRQIHGLASCPDVRGALETLKIAGVAAAVLTAAEKFR